MAAAAEPSTLDVSPGSGPAEGPSPTAPADLEDWALAALACPRCETDLARLPSARFCPRCGVALVPPPVPVSPLAENLPAVTSPDGEPAVVPPPAPTPQEAAAVELVLAEWQRLQQSGALQDPIDLDPGPPALEGPRSAIIAGYANALYRLGWRYERHLGFERNVSEAVRCYLKAARLGNEEALARLVGKSDG